MNRTLEKLQTLWALGPDNLARVGLYRLSLRLGVHPVLGIRAGTISGRFFATAAPANAKAVPTKLWQDKASYFSRHEFPLDGIPDWLANPFRPGARASAALDWNRIPDFNPAVGDIKTIWEASRFDWLVAMAQRAAAGSTTEFDRLNLWLADWLAQNPPYKGPNWKCGQEASIRVMHMAVASLVLGGAQSPTEGLRNLLWTHLQRIAPTMGYAIGQSNNHGTSEAAALFIAGQWLGSLGNRKAGRMSATGRRWLEERAGTLIAEDGTFSQYSVTYHRLMLDTYSLCEAWRRHSGARPFSPLLYRRLNAATTWLQQLVDRDTGDAPNLGANDGVRLMPLSATAYRDFRPSLQLASALFCDARAIGPEGPWDQPGQWLGIPAATADLAPPHSTSLDQGGLHVMRTRNAAAYLRYPRFRFRPSQADALHLDFWHKGANILRDAGTYSYVDDAVGYFPSAQAHNTVQFDSHDQMPRLGRFLFGAWLEAQQVEKVRRNATGDLTSGAAYRDHWGAVHHRQVTLGDRRLACIDELSGAAEKATLRWRLAPGNWRLDGSVVTDGTLVLSIHSETPVNLILTEGLESRHYLEQSSLPVLEVTTAVPNRITTELVF